METFVLAAAGLGLFLAGCGFAAWGAGLEGVACFPLRPAARP
jgi:hypothetical protein